MDDMQFREKLRRYYALWREDNEIYGEWAQARGFSYFELMALSALAEGGRTQRAICDQWSMSKQTVHSILRLFLARGWVTLEPRTEDRRSKTVRLTAAGEAVALPLHREMIEHERRVWEALGEETVDALMDIQARYIRVFREVQA